MPQCSEPGAVATGSARLAPMVDLSLNLAGNIDYLKFIYPGIIGMSILFTSPLIDFA